MMEAALSPKGTPRIPAVICYEGIFIRDHWPQITSHPWWYRESPSLEHQRAWRQDLLDHTSYDWFTLPMHYTEEDRRYLSVSVEGDHALLSDDREGTKRPIPRPSIGGWSSSKGIASVHPEVSADTAEEVACRIEIPGVWRAEEIAETGKNVLAQELIHGDWRDRFPICHVASPLWLTYGLWGFETMMVKVATQPDLVTYACSRFLTLQLRAIAVAAALGARGIWIEDCLTDMVSADAYRALNVPFLNEMITEIRSRGMKSIYYFCGDPRGKLDSILSLGADALSFEESKKGFTIDTASLAEQVDGRSTLLGNLDAIGVLERGTEVELRTEIQRQLQAAKRNRNRFVMSIGSPVTPGTAADRVRLYCDLVHELGRM